jgi:PAS domain-containing protein
LKQELGDGWTEGVHPDDLKACVADYSAAFKKRSSFKLKYRLKYRDGSYHWLLDFGCPFFGDNNDFLGYIGSCYDIEDTEKFNETAKSLQESDERFRVLFENMTEGVAVHEMIYDKKGKAIDYRIQSINGAYEKFTGLSSAQAVGSLATVLYKSKTPPYIDEYAEVVRTGKPYFFETYFQPMDKHFSISVFSLKNGNFVTAFEDVSLSKNNEIELKKSRDELQSKLESMEKFNELMIGRELKMVELKETISKLEEKLAQKK